MKIERSGQNRPARATAESKKPVLQNAVGFSSPPRDIKDNSSILGIPEEELTPRVQEAVTGLMLEVQSLRQSIKDLTRRLKDAEQVADQDPLLPIYNRRAFVRELSRVKASVERYQTEASLVYIDLNQFKTVNDSHGHEAGDYVLSQVALRLKESVRDTDIVGRLGGDEFGLILARTKPQDARHLIDRLPRLFAEKPIIWNGAALPTSLSTGIVPISAGENPEQTLSAADTEMYKEKNSEDRVRT